MRLIRARTLFLCGIWFGFCAGACAASSDQLYDTWKKEKTTHWHAAAVAASDYLRTSPAGEHATEVSDWLEAYNAATSKTGLPPVPLPRETVATTGGSPATPPSAIGLVAPVLIAGGEAVCQDMYYPPIAIRLNQVGTTVVNVHIGADASISKVDIVGSSGHDSLDQATIKCIMAWRYKPAMQNGVAVPALQQYTIKWVLR